MAPADDGDGDGDAELVVRLPDDAPTIRIRTRRVSIGRGQTRTLPAATARRLVADHDSLRLCCSALLDSGGRCTRRPDSCPYHDDSPGAATDAGDE